MQNNKLKTQGSLSNRLMIKVKQNISRSTNMKIDFEDPHFFKHFILSEKFQNKFVSITDSLIDHTFNQKVYVISGTPGVGKSTFALLITRLLSNENKQNLLKIIDQQKHNASKKFIKNYNLIKALTYLPVFLHGDEGEIEDAFYMALKSSFDYLGYEKEFEEVSQSSSVRALEIIDHWESHYPHKYNEMKSFIQAKCEDYKVFLKSLKYNKRNAQKLFAQAYKQITGGASMTSYRHGQVIDLYQNALTVLKKKKINGIFIVYDEFGKYLERGVKQPSAFDLQFLQDMAESCNKSSGMHLLLITHLPISQYAVYLPTTVQKEWTKIEGRFYQMSFNSSYESSYTVLGSVFESNIQKQSKVFWQKLKVFVDQWILQNKSTGCFPDLYRVQKITQVVMGCYPLHPSVLSLLPLLSEKVAQNERTLFSFLTQNEEFSLNWFLKRNTLLDSDMHFIGPYELYFYFKNTIASDIGIGGTYRIELMASEVLNSLDISQICEKNIIALLAIAKVINNKSIIKITHSSLKSLLYGLHKDIEINKAIKYLQQNKQIIFDKVRNELVLFEGSSIDLKEEINKVKQGHLTTSGYVHLLKKHFGLSFVIPKKYNFANGITRYYRENIISLEELEELEKLEEKNSSVDYAKEDGRVYYVIAFTNADISKIKNKLCNIYLKSCLFITINRPLEIESELLELQAIESLYSQKEMLTSGPLVKKELDHYRQTVRDIIKKSLKKLYSNTQRDVSGFYQGKCLNDHITQSVEISDLVSHICEKEYNKYPLFYNEMINKHKASTPVIQGRIRLMQAFDRCHLKRYGIQGGGPEFALYKALLRSNAFEFKETSDKSKLFLGFKKESVLIPLFEDFCHYLKASEKSPILIADLMDRWRRPPFGLRLPLIPLYLNLFSRMVSSPISFFHNGVFVGKIDLELFENLMKQPKKYSLRMIHLDDEKLCYLKQLVEVFSKPIPYFQPLTELNFISVAKVISQFYSLVPVYTRRHKNLTTRQKKLVAVLDVFRQPETFILEDLPQVYTQKAYMHLNRNEKNIFLNNLANDLEQIFSLYVHLIERIAQLQKNALLKLKVISGSKAFDEVKQGSPLALYWKTLLNEFSDEIVSFPYSENTLMFVNRILQLSKDASNQLVVESLADALTRVHPKSWSEKGESLFQLNLQRAVSEIEQIYYWKLGAFGDLDGLGV